MRLWTIVESGQIKGPLFNPAESPADMTNARFVKEATMALLSGAFPHVQAYVPLASIEGAAADGAMTMQGHDTAVHHWLLGDLHGPDQVQEQPQGLPHLLARVRRSFHEIILTDYSTSHGFRAGGPKAAVVSGRATTMPTCSKRTRTRRLRQPRSSGPRCQGWSSPAR